MKKYNIAYIPSLQQSQLIAYAAELAAVLGADKYLLGEKSIPHVSLCHFEQQESEVANVWQAIKALALPSLQLTFNSMRSKTYPDHPLWDGVSWLSLMPDKLAELTAIHLKITAIVKNPLNAAFNDYDPHLTLLNCRDRLRCAQVNLASKVDPAFTDEFSLALGPIDDEGQLITILYV